jgi:hypothetical protein
VSAAAPPSAAHTEKRWRPGLVLVVTVTTAFLAVMTWRAWTIKEYIQSSPDYCARCHPEQAKSTRPAGHESFSCQQCHTVPTDGIAALVRSVFDVRATLAPHASVPSASCDECHLHEKIGELAMRAPGHSVHAHQEKVGHCSVCHGENAHGGLEPALSCMKCHGDIAIETDRVDYDDCVNCHAFSGRPNSSPMVQVIDATASDGSFTVDESLVHGAADCGVCHSPHIKGGTAKVVCTLCHRGPIAASVEDLPPRHQKCLSCHQPHQPRSELEFLCLSCHPRPRVGGTMEATRSRGEGPEGPVVPDAGPEAGSTSSAGNPTAMVSPSEHSIVAVHPHEKIGTSAALDIPHQGKCASCHTPHFFVGQWTASCESCHEEQQDEIALLRSDTHSTCIGCHEPHSPKPTGATCRGCHPNPAQGASDGPVRHRDCLSCHKAHGARPAFSTTCNTCHADLARGRGKAVGEHRQCETCHSPHGAPAVSTPGSCRRCHEEQVRRVATSKQEPHQRCGSCHKGHAFSGVIARVECARCHDQMAASTAVHTGACVTCHDAHGPAGTRARACHTCHGEVRPTVAEHRQCQKCHRPHVRGSGALDSCAECHGAQARAARAWRGGTPHSGPCTGCHGRHDERSRPTCASCHAEQNTPAHVGDHDGCRDCHNAHRTPPGGPGGWWAGCIECHRPQANAISSGGPTHSRCDNCHDRPGRVAPSCRSCHEAVVSQLAHANPRHAPCGRCHVTHGAQRPQRRQCLACHEAQRDHYPEATECQVCHPFAGAR